MAPFGQVFPLALSKSESHPLERSEALPPRVDSWIDPGPFRYQLRRHLKAGMSLTGPKESAPGNPHRRTRAQLLRLGMKAA